MADRVRGGAFLIQAVAGSVMIGATLYLTFHLQIVLGMSRAPGRAREPAAAVATMIIAPIATEAAAA